MQAKTKEVAALTATIEAKTKQIGDLGVAFVTMKEDLADTQESLSDDKTFLADLEKRAKACGVGPSEWHEMRRQPLWQVLFSVEALEHPTSPSVGSSS